MPAAAHLALLLSIAAFGTASAGITCENDEICAEKYGEGSVCVDGTCSNPFASGCFNRYFGNDKWPRLRTCNSDDPPDSASRGICSKPLFDYEEIRILSQNWHSSMLTSWVMQIVLSELAGVPATIETSSSDLNFSFYDPKGAFGYSPVSYDYNALRTARDHGGCRDAPAGTPCAHVMPEVWNGQRAAMTGFEEEGLIEPPLGAGGAAKYSWYIPKFTAEKHKTFLSYFGLTMNGTNDEEIRRKLAETFKRPFTWKDYCLHFTEDYCSTPDDVAERAPIDENEEVRYFASGLFTGFFNATEENDCDANPTTCTGHITNVICSWSTFAIPQAHYLKIPVKSSGSDIAGGYPYSRFVEIVDAANATKTDILLYYWIPDPKVHSFLGTSFELQRILLPPPTLECIKSRVTEEQRCSDEPLDRIGDIKGACDSELDLYQKLIVSNLHSNTYKQDEASRSPGYDVVKSFSISNLEVDQILSDWHERNTDRWNLDAREAVCRWSAENLDKLQRRVPRGYPRLIKEESNLYDLPAYLYAALSFGILAATLTSMTWAATCFYRKKRVMVFAQVDFLHITLCGLLFVCTGGIIYAVTPSRLACISRVWLVVLGYSLELIPFIVKASALNKLFQSASRAQRVKIDRKKLYATVGVFVSIAVIFLSVWTAVDPPTPQIVSTLTSEVNAEGGLYVEVSYTCASQSPVWQIINLTYQLVLLTVATVLAFQTRNVRQEFNEASKLAFAIYSHFIFVVLRTTIFFLSSSIKGSIVSCVSSFVLSFDCIAMLGIYFVPKLIEARDGQASQASQTVHDNMRDTVTFSVQTTGNLPRKVISM